MQLIILLSFATASVAFTITETKIFAPLRQWLEVKSGFLGSMFSCGYCLGHWIAFALTAIYQPRLFEAWWLLDYFLTALVIAWFAAFQWIVMCWLMKLVDK